MFFIFLYILFILTRCRISTNRFYIHAIHWTTNAQKFIFPVHCQNFIGFIANYTTWGHGNITETRTRALTQREWEQNNECVMIQQQYLAHNIWEVIIFTVKMGHESKLCPYSKYLSVRGPWGEKRPMRLGFYRTSLYACYPLTHIKLHSDRTHKWRNPLKRLNRKVF